MPIKFRCQQCRQFLGISRAQAGEVVDCPTCGRTIRVPELDGTVKPLPQPGLKFDDTRLKHALDEIALIGDEQPQKPGDGAKPDEPASDDAASRGNVGTRAGVATLDEPSAIELPPLPAPEPVALSPLPTRGIDYGAAVDDEALSSESSEEDRPWRSTAQPRDSWKQLIADAALKEKEDWEAASAAELAGCQADKKTDVESGDESASAVDPSAGQAEPSAPVVAIDRESAFLGFSTWFAIVGLIVLICSAGFWIGRSTAITWSIDQTGQLEQEPSPVVPVNSAAAGELVAGIEGRITWKSESGQWIPDRDACVIVLPVNRDGVSRVSFVGLRRGDSDEDRQMVESSLQAMGGAVGFADEAGRFQITLSEPGEYHVLILSRSVGRSADADDTETVETLSRYFDRAEQLLGRLAYRFETIRFPGSTAVPLDAGFELQN